VTYEPTSTAVVGDVCPDGSPEARGGHERRAAHRVTVDLDRFAWEALEQEAAHLGVSVEELARFAVLYYLADGDSGRVARRLSPPDPPGEPHPLSKLLGG
jgi:hypothetical protein